MASYSSDNKRLARRQGVILAALACLISLLSAVMAFHDAPGELNRLHYDLTQSLNRLPPAEDLVIVEIDDKSLSAMGYWPWPRALHAQLVTTLSEAGARLIVFDILFPSPDTQNPHSDETFALAIAQNNKVVLPIYFESLGPRGTVVETPPHQPFYLAAHAVGHIHLQRDSDGVVRTIYLKEGVGKAYWPHLSLAALQSLSPRSEAMIPGLDKMTGATPPSNISLVRDKHNYLPMPHPTQGIRHFSYSDLLQSKTDPNQLRDKIIFVGATGTGLGDIFATPAGAMHGVELNAWIFQALRHERLIQAMPPLYNALVSGLIILILVSLLGRLSPRLFLLLSVFSVATLGALSSLLLLYAGRWFPPAAAMLGIALFFPLWSWLRAEGMLRYLRDEMQNLNTKTTARIPDAALHAQAKNYLSQLELIDAETEKPTAKGLGALHQLNAATEPTSIDQHFWQEQLEEKRPRAVSSAVRVEGVELISRTISQLDAARQQDQRSRRMIEQSLSALQDGVCITDLCGTVRFSNKRFREWFVPSNMSAERPDLLEVLSVLKLDSGLSWPQALQQTYLENKAFSDEASFRDDKTGKHQNAKQFLCQISLVSTWRDIKDTLILVFTDISKLKAAEIARAEALSFLSHDLRSPMVSVLAILERNRIKGTLPDPKDVGNIEVLVGKNLDYAESFLQLSKAENLPDTALEPTDLHGVLDSAQVHASALAAGRQIRIDMQRCKEEAWVLGESSLLERALNNLVSNAIKYSPSGSTIILALKLEDQQFILSVEDEGSGIAPEQRDSLFVRFKRQRHDSTHGAGLGLNFVATVASRFHGKVLVDSERDKGSRFSLALPALSAEDIDAYFGKTE